MQSVPRDIGRPAGVAAEKAEALARRGVHEDPGSPFREDPAADQQRVARSRRDRQPAVGEPGEFLDRLLRVGKVSPRAGQASGIGGGSSLRGDRGWRLRFREANRLT